MSQEAYIEEGSPDGKLIYDTYCLEGGLVKMASELLEENARGWKAVLEVDSIDLMELGRMLMIGGLAEALGDGYLHYLREKRGYSPELIKESLETYRKCFEHQRERSPKLEDRFIRADLVGLGHTYVNVFNDNSSLPEMLWIERVVLGKIKVDVTKWK